MSASHQLFVSYCHSNQFQSETFVAQRKKNLKLFDRANPFSREEMPKLKRSRNKRERYKTTFSHPYFILHSSAWQRLFLQDCFLVSILQFTDSALFCVLFSVSFGQSSFQVQCLLESVCVRISKSTIMRETYRVSGMKCEENCAQTGFL